MPTATWTQLLAEIDQGESSTHDIFTQFLGGPSQSEVQIEQAKGAAAAAAATGYSDTAKTAAIAVGVLAFALVAVVALSGRGK